MNYSAAERPSSSATRLARWLLLAMVTGAGIVSAPSCGGTGGSSLEGDTAGATGGAGGVRAGSGFGAGAMNTSGGAGMGEVASLAIEPASAEIVVTNGVAAPASIAFKAKATLTTGSTVERSASWSFDKPQMALIAAGAGTLTASGKMGGAGTVTATIDGVHATASVTVRIVRSADQAAITPQELAALNAATGADPSGARLLYPYDRTVFARGVLAPELMWSGGVDGDAYAVSLRSSYFDAKLYVRVAPPARLAIPDDVWKQLTASNAGEDVNVDVTRITAGQAFAPMHEAWTIAQGSLLGTIYYWAVSTGQIMKLGPGEKAPSIAFDSGPAAVLGDPVSEGYDGSMPPWEPASGGSDRRCVACHTVSRDGSTIAGIFDRRKDPMSPWGAVNAASGKVTSMSSYQTNAGFLALSPDGSKLVANTGDMKLSLADTKTGKVIPSLLDGFADATAHPAFSPDGGLLAFASNVSNSRTSLYPVEFSRSDLDIVGFDAASSTFTGRRQLISGLTQTVAYPSFSPDSKWVFYQKGDFSRAKYELPVPGSNPPQSTPAFGNDDLYMVDVAGTAHEIALDATNGAINGAPYVEPRNLHRNYQPTVNPVAVGGYYWVVFVSPRDYGNRLLSTTEPALENHKQLWVAAVDANPTPGKDPSHPAFLLAGQDTVTTNMSGYWALSPCKQNGDASGCEQGFECCSGFCRSDDTGTSTCVAPPGGCSKIGEACSNGGDCCNAPTVDCIGGVCSHVSPGVH